MLQNRTITRQYTDSSAQQEYRYDKNKLYSADVAIFHKGVLESIVEVRVTHATTGDAPQSRTACVGVNNVWEISAVQILGQHTELYTTANAVEVRSLLTHEPARCACKIYPGCHAHHANVDSRACHACSREWDEWNKEWLFIMGGMAMMVDHASIHINKIPGWQRSKFPTFQDIVEKRFEDQVHRELDEFDFASASWDLKTCADIRQVECSAKRRFDQMKHSLRVLTPVFKRLSAYLNWKSFSYQMVDEGDIETAVEHLNSKPGWGDTENHGEDVKSLYVLYLRKSSASDRMFSIKGNLAKPLVPIEEPLLSELKVAVLPLIRAENVLKRFLQKLLVYIRGTLAEREVADRQRRHRQYKQWVQPQLDAFTPIVSKKRRPVAKIMISSASASEVKCRPIPCSGNGCDRMGIIQ